MDTKDVILKTEADTVALAQELAPSFSAGDILLLRGDLGAGKSTFMRALLRAMGCVERHLPSPTYTIMQVYDEMAVPVIHMDAYRLSGEEDLATLEIDALRETHFLAVEWPEVLGWEGNMANPYGRVVEMFLTHEGGVRTAVVR